VQTIELRGLSDLSHSISWDLITSDPPTSVSSTSYSIKLYRVTATNETFVVWKTDYSSDGSLEVIQDQKYKQHENFQALRDTLKPQSKQLDIKITEQPQEPKSDLQVSIQSPVATDIPKPETEEEKKRRLQESDKQREILRKQKEENEKLIGAVNLKKTRRNSNPTTR